MRDKVFSASIWRRVVSLLLAVALALALAQGVYVIDDDDDDDRRRTLCGESCLGQRHDRQIVFDLTYAAVCAAHRAPRIRDLYCSAAAADAAPPRVTLVVMW